MISYAQNGEDVVLARLFRDQPTGTWIDVGAGHPVEDSVTKHFYDRGWRGVNIEPAEHEFQMLCEQRPGDRNLKLAISDHEGEAVLHVAPRELWGASTLERTIAAGYSGTTGPFEAVTVRTTTLTRLVAELEIEAVDFLKIDVEGHETAVIAGTDWAQIRPRALVIEATRPNTPEPIHAAWEPDLLAAGYRCALFDGLNRFYVQEDDTEAAEALGVPANVFDEARPWRWVRQIEDAEHRATLLSVQRREVERELREARAEVEAAAAARAALEARVHELELCLQDPDRAARDLVDRLAAVDRSVAELHRQAVDIQAIGERDQPGGAAS